MVIHFIRVTLFLLFCECTSQFNKEINYSYHLLVEDESVSFVQLKILHIQFQVL